MSSYTDALLASAEEVGAWQDLPFFRNNELEKAILPRLDTEEAILPPADQVFRSLTRLSPEKVRVVILGQDPYPTPGHAHGLSFSVEKTVSPLPRSLRNIFAEMQDDIGAAPAHGDLSHWVDQGVLLLNTALTVRANEAGSHAKIGWSSLTDQIVTELANMDSLVWVLWGNHAKAFRPRIEAGSGKNLLIIESAHPSPLSARRGFFNSKPFSRINIHLANHAKQQIQWVV